MNAGQITGLFVAVSCGLFGLIVLLEWAWTEFKYRRIEKLAGRLK